MTLTINEKNRREAYKAIHALYADLSVSKEEAIENLQLLIDEIKSLIETLE